MAASTTEGHHMNKPTKPRGKYALGIKVEKKFTAPDGVVFDTYQRCMSYTMQQRKRAELDAFMEGQPPEVRNFVIHNRYRLKELL
jgi:hypothetical protein